MTVVERMMLAVVFEAVREAGEGRGLASLADVRRLAGELDVDGEAFEWALLRLASERRVVLHFHDCPSAMTPAERAAAIARGGVTYHAAAVR